MITGKVLGDKYIMNGVAADVSGFIPDMTADIYYEVVRMIDRKFLFLQDHLDRLRHSLSGSGLTYPGDDAIRENLRLLQNYNDFSLGNIRICIQSDPHNGIRLSSYFIPYVYPETCMYKTGVQLVTYPHVRPNPCVKKWDDDFRVSVNEYIREHGVYEVILLNRKYQVTEGSRSNLFFLSNGNRLVTAPEMDVLPGITRKYVFSICKEEGIEVIERSIRMDELGDMHSCFISGTSPKILPVWKLDHFQFSVDHPLLRLLMERYEVLIKDHLESLATQSGN